MQQGPDHDGRAPFACPGCLLQSSTGPRPGTGLGAGVAAVALGKGREGLGERLVAGLLQQRDAVQHLLELGLLLVELLRGDGELQLVAGSGDIGLADGTGEQAAFAQPAALALVQRTLYVADAASSSIRSVHLGEGRGVQTLVGRELFDFGDSEGTRSAARLQAPAGLALDPESPLLWIADTGNDCLKVLRLGGGDVRRFELEYLLHEPTALAAQGGMLWLANSGSHEVLRIEIETGRARRLAVGE